jgi:hypothetical protein
MSNAPSKKQVNDVPQETHPEKKLNLLGGHTFLEDDDDDDELYRTIFTILYFILFIINN